MSWISDGAMARLAALPDLPDFSGTRYELRGEIDRGGMGIVYAAFDRTLGREVAIKVLRDGVAGEGAESRLARESTIMAGLEHPGIVPVHDAGTLPDGRAFCVMKKVRGTRVDALARAGLSLPETLRLFTRICEPVAFAHARGVVHRDLKPENVMVGEFGEVVVMDWGVAKLLGTPATGPSAGRGTAGEAPAEGVLRTGSPLTSDGDVIGTKGYMAPEQERGDTAGISPRSDVWALGAILRELAATAAPAHAEPPRPLSAIVARATASDPADRYASAAELAADVVRFADGEAVTAYRESAWEKGLRWTRRNRTAVGVVAAYVVMRAVLYFWLGR
ncbi:MAG: serine/threonine-protein kinase [Vicinamibacteria bacterium]